MDETLNSEQWRHVFYDNKGGHIDFMFLGTHTPPCRWIRCCMVSIHCTILLGRVNLHTYCSCNFFFQKLQESIPAGCLPSAAVAISLGCLPRRQCLPGVDVCPERGVCRGGCLPRGCLPRGVAAQRGVSLGVSA